jgi:hypothetical protein
MRHQRAALVSCAAFLAIILPAVSGSAQTAEQANAFVRQLYSQYEHPSSLHGPDILGKQAASVFSPGLLALIRKEENATPPGDSGKLDFDPVCSCQDPDGLKLTDLHVSVRGANKALATATLSFPDSAKIEVRLSLLWTPQNWRVDDISTKEVPSLRKLLESPGD